jgi:uncharacterized protein involved in exopolysaccharide biosynthesis
LPDDLGEFQKAAEEADRRVLEFQRTQDVAGAQAALADIDRLRQRVDEARARSAEARRRLEQAQRSLAGGPDPLDASALTAAGRALADIERRRAGTEARLGPFDPETIALDEQALSARRQVKAEIARLASLADSEVEALAAAEEMLARGREAARSATERLAANNAQLRMLQRQAEAANAMFEAALAAARRADAPDPSRPRLILPAASSETPTS